MKHIFIALTLLSLTSYAFAAELDPTFGTNGKVTIDVGLPAQIDEIEVLDDGSILAAGHTFSTTSTYGELFLVRLTANGERISSFGINGVSFLTAFEEVQSVDFVGVKDNGKFVAAGTFLENGESTKFVAQFLPNGNRDNGFSDDGLVTNTVVGGATEIVGDSVVLAGRVPAPETGNYTAAAVSLLDNGGFDSRFGNDSLFVPSGPHTGRQTTNRFVELSTIADGSLLFAITKRGTDGLFADYYLKTNEFGQVDESFAEKGFLLGETLSGGWRISSKLLSDGTVLIKQGSTIQRIEKYDSSGEFISEARYFGEIDSFHEVGNEIAVSNSMEIVFLNRRFGKKSFISRDVFKYAEDFDESGKAILAGSLDQKGVIGKFSGSKPIQRKVIDYDGDGLSDFGVYSFTDFVTRVFYSNGSTEEGVPVNSTGFFENFGGGNTSYAFWDFTPARDYRFLYNLELRDPTTQSEPWGIEGDLPTVGDFTGDHISDFAVFRNGEWWIQANDGTPYATVQWGLPGDIPVVADYDGDFIDDIAVFRPSNSQWWVQRSSDGETYALQFGLPGDKPVPADYDGDGAEDVAVYRPSEGVWYLWQSTDGFAAIRFGSS